MFSKRSNALSFISMAMLFLLTSCTSLLPVLPTVILSSSTTLGVVPLAVTLHARTVIPGKASAEEWTFVWDLGDGTTAEGASITHTYTRLGRYRARLSASLGEDFATERSLTINVLAAPQFDITRYATGLMPMATAVIDMNLDAQNDLISANAKSHSISVFLADGSTFVSTPYTYQALKSPSGALQPQAIAVGDINADTLPDLIVLNPPDDNLTLLFGNGIGGFQTPSGYHIPSPQQAVVADFDGDQYDDVIVVGRVGTHSKIMFMQGKGTGELTLGHTIFEHFLITDIEAGDVDNDGDLDLVLSTKGFGVEILVLLNEGNGQFAAPLEVLLETKPNNLVLFRANQDDNLDIMTANVDGTLSLLLGDGSGAFDVVLNVVTHFEQVSNLVAADLNGDATKDIVFQYQRGEKSDIAMLLGDGQGHFSEMLLLDGFYGAMFPVVSSINNDNLKDLVLVSPDTNELLLAINKTPQ